MNTQKRSSHVRLAATLFSLATAACAVKPAASGLKISHGAPVDVDSADPERISTAGLTALTPGGTYTCSAAIIGNAVLVTAAHCVEPGAKIYAYFGPNMARASTGEFTLVADAVIHPDFDPDQATNDLPLNDVALLHLSRLIPAGYEPVPILPSETDLQRDDVVEVAGYGITDVGGDSGELRYTRTTYIGPDRKGRLQINDARRRGACSGDSGGPLFGEVNGVFYLGGVLSGGPIPCRGINFYTSLALQRPFIDRTIAAFAEPPL
ncbi:MAG: trypsin-like serine protease [Proteobacteria bacterium]|nr:trypsin-like serine protease [Pseudomonadota bacterium]